MMGTTAEPCTTPRRLFLVSVPRTASNLLVKVLGILQQPNVLSNEKAGYFFQDAYLLGTSKGYFSKPLSQWTDAETAEILSAYQHCLDNLEGASEAALHQGKTLFTKEHAFWFANLALMLPAESSSSSSSSPNNNNTDFHLTLPSHYPNPQTFSPGNQTLFPDSYLSTWHFAFIIRHPALAWPSMYRTILRLGDLRMLDEKGIRATAKSNMTFRWTRSLYEWCVERSPSSMPPIILDAYDVAHSPEVILRFCEMTGLDKNLVQFEWGGKDEKYAWEKGGEEKTGRWEGELVDKAAMIFTETLRASKGVMKEKTPKELDVEEEVEKWKVEFGGEVAEFLEAAVRETIGDYEYLRERRLTVD